LDARIFKRVEGILRFEKARVEACGNAWCSWMQEKGARWLMLKLTSTSI